MKTRKISMWMWIGLAGMWAFNIPMWMVDEIQPLLWIGWGVSFFIWIFFMITLLRRTKKESLANNNRSGFYDGL